jgi:hypothetical protein
LVFQCSAYSLDWKGYDAAKIQQRVLSKVEPGSIILFHNAALHTPEALPGIIESLQKQGYNLVPVSQLIYKDNYTIDVAGKQHGDASASSSTADSSSAENNPGSGATSKANASADGTLSNASSAAY